MPFPGPKALPADAAPHRASTRGHSIPGPEPAEGRTPGPTSPASPALQLYRPGGWPPLTTTRPPLQQSQGRSDLTETASS